MLRRYISSFTETLPGWNREQGWMVGKKKDGVGAQRSGATSDAWSRVSKEANTFIVECESGKLNCESALV